MESYPLNESQKQIIDECKSRKLTKCGLSLPLGYGKTRIGICLGLEMSELPILVVVSKTLLAGWINEIENAFGKDFPYEILHKSFCKDFENWKIKKETRLVIVTCDTVVCAYKSFHIENLILNYIQPQAFAPVILEYIYPKSPLLTGDIPNIGALYSIHWGTLIVDEIQKYTEITTKKCRSLISIASHNRFVMSGTIFDEPKITRFLGFSSILHLNVPRTLPSFTEFMDSDQFAGFEKYTIKRTTNTEFVKPKYTEQIISHSLNEYEVKVFSITKTLLKELRKKVIDSKRKGDVIGQRLYSAYMMATITYLRQALICPLIPITSIYCDMGDFKARSELSEIAMEHFTDNNLTAYLESDENIISSRFKAIITKIIEHQNQKCIVFSAFRSVITLLMNICETQMFGRQLFTISSSMSIKTRKDVISNFEKSDNAVLLMTYDIGAEGLNLQCASVVMLVDLWWNSAKMDQAIGRVYRPGQKSDVNVYMFVSNTFIESKLIEKNTVKSTIINEVQTGKIKTVVPKISVDRIMEMVDIDDNIQAIEAWRI